MSDVLLPCHKQLWLKKEGKLQFFLCVQGVKNPWTTPATTASRCILTDMLVFSFENTFFFQENFVNWVLVKNIFQNIIN